MFSLFNTALLASPHPTSATQAATLATDSNQAIHRVAAVPATARRLAARDAMRPRQIGSNRRPMSS